MSLIFSTREWTMAERQERWINTIGETYFSLGLKFIADQPFEGSLQRWSNTPSDLSISHLSTSQTHYARTPHHIAQDREAYYLVTVPRRSDVVYVQSGNDLLCRPGSFIIQRSDTPFDFKQCTENELWVLKIPESALKGLLREPERYARFCFNATEGLGRIFIDQLIACAMHLDECPATAHTSLMEQLLTTLRLTLQQDERVLSSESSRVCSLHLARVERYVLQHLSDPELSPQAIAKACTLSLRYLHKLFSATPYTLSEWIRHQRLEAVYRQLRNPQCHLSIGELAFRSGFNDQAQFTRAFRQHFGSTAREIRTPHH